MNPYISVGMRHHPSETLVLIVRSASDTLREGKMTDEHGADAGLNVLEVDAAILKARLVSNRAMWPEQAPPLDGVIVCCDVSKRDSFAEVQEVLRLCTPSCNPSRC